MAVTFKESAVAAQRLSPTATRQRLLTDARVPGTKIFLDRFSRHGIRRAFVPGKCRTVWAEGAAVCTWTPTGRDIRGEMPAREIQGHSSAVATPQDV